MSNPPISTVFALPSPNAAPLDLTQLIILLNQLVQSSMGGGDYMPYVISHSTPNVDDRGRVWIQTDTTGRPIATKIWVTSGGGAWRRIYNGMPGQICMYNGTPTDDFDDNGLGLIGKNYDGWSLCNGKNGTIDLTDRFIIAAHMNKLDGKAMYDNGWGTWVQDDQFEKTGGSKDFALNADNTWHQEFKSGKWVATGTNRVTDDTYDLWGRISNTEEDKNKVIIEGNDNPDHISNIPPFVALGFVQFIGYIT